MPHHLVIVVAPDCPQCDRGRALAAAMAARVPTLRVELRDLADGRPVPPHVVATPTYLLDGAVSPWAIPTRRYWRPASWGGSDETRRRISRTTGRPRSRSRSTARRGAPTAAARRVLDAQGARYRWVDIATDPVC